MDNDKDKYISLKEASKISGYAPDYIGQLIRQGKLPGKQIYYNVAWVTTEKAIRGYLSASQTDKLKKPLPPLDKLFKPLLYSAIAVLAVFLLVLFYIFSANIDKKLDQRAIEKIQGSLQNK